MIMNEQSRVTHEGQIAFGILLITVQIGQFRQLASGPVLGVIVRIQGLSPLDRGTLTQALVDRQIGHRVVVHHQWSDRLDTARHPDYGSGNR